MIGTSQELLDEIQAPTWIERVSVENLRLLLGRHRHLARNRDVTNELLRRWLVHQRDSD